MELKGWPLIIAIIIILALVVTPFLFEHCDKIKIQDKLVWQKVRNDSILNAKVFSDTVHKVEILKMKKLLAQRPAVIHDTVILSDTNRIASVMIDTSVSTQDEKGNEYQVPFLTFINYNMNKDLFDCSFEMGLI